MLPNLIALIKSSLDRLFGAMELTLGKPIFKFIFEERTSFHNLSSSKHPVIGRNNLYNYRNNWVVSKERNKIIYMNIFISYILYMVFFSFYFALYSLIRVIF